MSVDVVEVARRIAAETGITRSYADILTREERLAIATVVIAADEWRAAEEATCPGGKGCTCVETIYPRRLAASYALCASLRPGAR